MWQHLLDPLKHGYYQDDHGYILPTKGSACATGHCWVHQMSVWSPLYNPRVFMPETQIGLHRPLFVTVKRTQTVTPNMTLRTVMNIYWNISSKWYRLSRSYDLYYNLVTGRSVLLLYRTIAKTWKILALQYIICLAVIYRTYNAVMWIQLFPITFVFLIKHLYCFVLNDSKHYFDTTVGFHGLENTGFAYLFTLILVPDRRSGSNSCEIASARSEFYLLTYFLYCFLLCVMPLKDLAPFSCIYILWVSTKCAYKYYGYCVG